jgi:hypothetical protein
VPSSKKEHRINEHFRDGDVDRASRLAPLAEHLERYGFVPVRDAMVLYGTKRRDEVLAVVGRRLNVTLVQTTADASPSDVVR